MFADAFNDIRNSKLLSEQSIRTMLTHPARRGWDVRPVDQRQGTPRRGYAGGCASRTRSGDARALFQAGNKNPTASVTQLTHSLL